MNEIKPTSYEYGEKHQLKQTTKYKNRKNNHWKDRIELVLKLVNYCNFSKFKNKQLNNIIDVGCSIGTCAIEFAKLGYRSYGINFDSSAIKIAKN